MTLESKLADIRAGAVKRIPEDKRAMMGAATNALRESGIMNGVVKVGDRLPAFSLENVNGEIVESSDLLSKGAVVLTIFRGSW